MQRLVLHILLQVLIWLEAQQSGVHRSFAHREMVEHLRKMKEVNKMIDVLLEEPYLGALGAFYAVRLVVRLICIILGCAICLGFHSPGLQQQGKGHVVHEAADTWVAMPSKSHGP